METEFTEAPGGFGGVPREQESQDFEIGALTPLTYDPVFMPNYGIAIEHQHNQPACGAHAGQEVMAIYKTIERGSVQRFSPEYIWKKIKMIDAIPPEDGTNMPSIMKILSGTGAVSFATMTNNSLLETLAQYTDPSSITSDMDIEAANSRIGVYAFGWSPTFEQLKAAIFTHKAVVLLMRVGSEFWVPGITEAQILPLKTDKPITSGHFVTAYGYDENFIYFYNHWGDKWGRAGIGYFGKDYMPRILEMGTTVNLSGNFQFTRELKQGDSGTDVGILQILLKKQNCFPQNQKITSFYGPVTFAAVSAFQLKYKAEILDPNNIHAPTGNVGPFTLKKLNSLI